MKAFRKKLKKAFQFRSADKPNGTLLSTASGVVNQEPTSTICEMNRLPRDIMERILIKSFVVTYVSVSNATPCHPNKPQPEEVTFQALASVCADWRKLSTERCWFRKALSHQLALRGMVHVKQLAQLEMDRCATGVAILNGCIYVSCNTKKIFIFDFETSLLHPEKIFVYDSVTLLRHPDKDMVVTVEGGRAMQALDIVACTRNACLYVADLNNRCILRLTDEGRIVVRWLDRPGRSFEKGLSVTPRGDVLLLDAPSRSIYIYDADSAFLYTVTLATDLRYPFHAVETLTGNFIVCHLGKDDEINRVSEVKRTGQIVRTYGAVRENEGPMCGLSHVAVTASGHVIVADRFNNRVLILDSEFGLQRVIEVTDDKGRGGPCRLCYSQERRQLVVGLAVSEGCLGVDLYGDRGGRTDVFSVRAFD